MTNTTNTRILVIQNDGAAAEGMEQCLRGLGFGVCAVAASVDEAIEKAAASPPDAAVVDLELLGLDAEMSGVEAAERIGSECGIPVVCLTDGAGVSAFETDRPPYPLFYVLKPFDERQLRLNLMTALSLRKWESRHGEIRSGLERDIDEMRAHVHMMDVIFNSMEEGVIATDDKGNRLTFNAGAVRIGGERDPTTRIGEWAALHGIYRLDKETLLPVEENPLVLAMHGVETDGIEVYVRNQDRPEGVFVSVTGRPLLDACGEQRGGVVVFHDITEKKLIDLRLQQTIEELTEQRRLAEEALMRGFRQGRLEMVDTILHNVGNAINSVVVGTDTLYRSLARDQLLQRLCALADAVKAHEDDWMDYIENDPQGRNVMPFIINLAADFTRRNTNLARTVERVRNRAKHIADIIRTEKTSNGAPPDRRTVNVRAVLSDAIDVVRESLEPGAIRFDLDCAEAAKEITTHESQFHQMLVNVITNSVQAIDELEKKAGGLGEEPRVRIRAGMEDGILNLEVDDNGIGFAHNDTRVFFTSGYTTKPWGAGLGLHSAANFVVGSGGQIELASDGIGKGAITRIMLPPPPGVEQDGHR